ncbi:hypothetical protein WN51_00774 [Melipona quadrifasciata]|uniref:Secreted protein n=1 Tax=Melipona quadrifasciata TaxID=166423 RepID=A0A0N0BF48_9HYME|nr:hypothetical protein WN51_00774 [Melipona quadrifasciata]
MRRRNVLCFLWVITILRIQGFVAAEADPAILSGTDLAHFQQIDKNCPDFYQQILTRQISEI